VLCLLVHLVTNHSSCGTVSLYITACQFPQHYCQDCNSSVETDGKSQTPAVRRTHELRSNNKQRRKINGTKCIVCHVDVKIKIKKKSVHYSVENVVVTYVEEKPTSFSSKKQSLFNFETAGATRQTFYTLQNLLYLVACDIC
jgi:NifB/MoaA-like Fe-S oxidoreductase